METVSNNAAKQNSTWHYLFTESADPRTSKWFLISNPVPVFVILLVYLYLVKIRIPRYMKNRKPYSLKKILMFYNLFQVAANLYLFSRAVDMWSRYNWHCQPVDYSTSPIALSDAWGTYLYFLNKISDLLDTVFFTLRKKDSQVTFLHVFHHSLMPLATWLIVKYIPGGHITFVGLLNTFVHVVLYLYYYLAAFGPKIQKYLWWKKYITKLQLIQFLILSLHNAQLLFFECDYPKWSSLLTLPNAIIFYYLFMDFYNKSYKPTNDSKLKQQKKK